MGPSDNRLTQIDMLALARTKPPANVAERAVLYDSLGYNSTPKGDALSNKGPCSTSAKAQLKIARSTTTDLLQLRTEWGSPWA
jgi:hypothetical protein